MSCDICGRQHHAQRLPFLCAVDARNRLYDGRMAHAHALMENERLEHRVNDLLALVQPSSPAALNARAHAWLSEERRAVDRTNEIIARADRLRAEVEAARKEIAGRKTALSRRKEDLAAVSKGLAPRRAKQQEDVERAVSVVQARWDLENDHMAATRSFLCMEAARLYGLRRLGKGSSARYEIGGVEIFELQAMNNSSPEVLSTCLAHMTHILMLASHYLAIRLPAEITLPHRDYPRPTIFSLVSSYSHGPDIPFPGSSSLPAQLLFEHHGGSKQPRPRPLFVDKPLQALAKEDSSMYSLFIEGVCLLAYDIAWACCSQGVPIGDRNSPEDVCNMGRNLYNLLIGTQLHANQAGRIFTLPSSSPSSGVPTSVVDADRSDRNTSIAATTTAATQMMGRYSHGTAHTFLGSADGHEFVRSFKLPNPIKLADRLKSKLSSESSAPDWELLDDDAWAGAAIDGQRDGHRQTG